MQIRCINWLHYALYILYKLCDDISNILFFKKGLTCYHNFPTL